MDGMQKAHTLLFDDQCPLCVRFQAALKKAIPADILHYQGLSDPITFSDFPQVDKSEAFEEIHLITNDNIVLKGPTAIEFLVTLSPQVKKFSWLIESSSGKKAVELFYKSANKYRESLRKSCPKCKKVSPI